MSYLGLLINTIEIIRTVTNKWQDPTEIVLGPHKARVEHDNKLVTNEKGQEVVSTATVFLPDDINIRYGDKLRIDYVPIDRPIIQINREQDSFGIHHIEVYL